jgi:hypothetical protein
MILKVVRLVENNASKRQCAQRVRMAFQNVIVDDHPACEVPTRHLARANDPNVDGTKRKPQLVRPVTLDRRRANNQPRARRRDGRQRDDRLMGFAEPHVIRENRSTAPDQKTDPLNLVWVKALCNRLCAPAGFVVVYERQIVSNPMR